MGAREHSGELATLNSNLISSPFHLMIKRESWANTKINPFRDCFWSILKNVIKARIIFMRVHFTNSTKIPGVVKKPNKINWWSQ